MGNNVFAPFSTHQSDGTVSIDLNSFVSRVLLFDCYIINTPLMKDLALLINNLGIEGLRHLINSGAVSIHSDATTLGQFQTKNPENGGRPQPTSAMHTFIPFNHYDPVMVSIPDREEYVGYGLKNLNDLNLPIKRMQKLKKAILDHLTAIPDNQGQMFPWMRQTLLANGQMARTATVNAIRLRQNRTIDETSLQISFETFGSNGLSATSNLRTLLGVDEYEEHKIIERAMLSMGGFYQRLILMNAYDSICWFSEDDSKLLSDEMKLVGQEVDSSMQERRLTRVLKLKGLPAVQNDQVVNVNTLMRLRESRECKQFRDWLRTSDAKTDGDIVKEINSYRAAFASALGSGPSRTARFLLSTAVGLVNPAAGIALGVTDQFVLDKLLKKNGPISFINNSLPKLGDL